MESNKKKEKEKKDKEKEEKEEEEQRRRRLKRRGTEEEKKKKKGKRRKGKLFCLLNTWSQICRRLECLDYFLVSLQQTVPKILPLTSFDTCQKKQKKKIKVKECEV